MSYAMFYAWIYLLHVMLVSASTSFHAFHVYGLIYMFNVSLYAYLHACVQIYRSLCLLLCLMPCSHVQTHVFMLMFTYLYAQILVFTCLSVWILFSHAQIYILTCLYVQIYMFSCHMLCFHAQIYLFLVFLFRSTCLISHFQPCLAQIYMFTCMFLCLYVQIYIFICLCASCHVYVFKTRLYLSCHVLLQAFCSFYHIFFCFGLMVRTQSRPYGLYHHPCTMAHIKRVWIIPICMSMLSMPSLNRSRKPPSSCLRSTTSRGDAPTHARPIGGPSRLILGVVCTEIQVLSLSRWRKVSVYLWQCGKNLG